MRLLILINIVRLARTAYPSVISGAPYLIRMADMLACVCRANACMTALHVRYHVA